MKEPLIESVFLTGEIAAEAADGKRILVLGGDAVALNLARRMIDEGFEVTLLGPTVAGSPIERLNVKPDTFLASVHGYGRHFQVDLRSSFGTEREHFDWIISAMPPTAVPKFPDYCLTPTDGILSLTELEAKLQAKEQTGTRKSDWLHAAFLCGLEGGSDPAQFRRVLDAIETLQRSGSVQCYVFARHLKVAAAGLERRYRECREKGTLFFKFDGPGPVIEVNGSGPVMTFQDPHLGIDLELEPDILVVDEHVQPPSSVGPLHSAIPSSPAFTPFLQPESTRFCGVETPRAGLLALGSSRGVFDPELMEADVEAALLAVKKSPMQRADLPGPAMVDPDKCTMCLTCVRLCPHGAMGFHRHAQADPDACVRCGICAVECPMAAIRLEPQPGTKDITGLLSDAIPRRGNGALIVAFLCSRSAAQALEAAWGNVPDVLKPIVVPCAGTTSVEHILGAFQQGAAAVLVAGCFKGNCASVYGTSLAEQRTGRTAAILKEIGIDPTRVMFTPISANMPWALKQAVQNLAHAIGV